MHRRSLNKIPLRTDTLAMWMPKMRKAIFALLVVQLTLEVVRTCAPSLMFPGSRWPEGLLVVLAAAATVVNVAKQLPGQNVLLASAIILIIAGGAQAFGASTGIPFGPYTYSDEMGPRLFGSLPAAIPTLWLVIVFTCRGVGRLVLKPWRRTRNYGFWLMGLTTALVVLFDMGFEPYATKVNHLWFWHPTHAALYWYGAPWVNFLGWAATTLVILAFTTPSLISKRQVKHPPDYQPLVMWILLTGVFVAGAIVRGLWAALFVEVVGTILITFFAIKGARW